MGSRLIFLHLLVVTDSVGCFSERAARRGGAAKESQEIAPAYRPYPKPTQVDW